VNGNATNDVNRIVLEKILERYPRIKENVDAEIESGKNPISLFRKTFFSIF
ncbi:MAG: hypothetical protein PWQ65_1201, partial [Bacteroidota bacterium]|nr:hypothetical protein [Bacteroidota bacterium]